MSAGGVPLPGFFLSPLPLAVEESELEPWLPADEAWSGTGIPEVAEAGVLNSCVLTSIGASGAASVCAPADAGLVAGSGGDASAGAVIAAAELAVLDNGVLDNAVLDTWDVSELGVSGVSTSVADDFAAFE